MIKLRIERFLRLLGLTALALLREPVALLILLLPLLLVRFAPQMPGMLSVDPASWWGLAGSSALLGFMGWFWTRAAMTEASTYSWRVERFRGAGGAPAGSLLFTPQAWTNRGRFDSAVMQWLSPPQKDQLKARTYAARFLIVLAGVLALAPWISGAYGNTAEGDLSFLISGGPVLVLAFVILLHRFLSGGLAWFTQVLDWIRQRAIFLLAGIFGPALILLAFGGGVGIRIAGLPQGAAPSQTPQALPFEERHLRLWRWRPLAVCAAAPFGFVFAVLMLLGSLYACVQVASSPEKLDDVSAPSAAFLALAMLIGPLTIIVAILKSAFYSGTYWIVKAIIWLVERLAAWLGGLAGRPKAQDFGRRLAQRAAAVRDRRSVYPEWSGLGDGIGLAALAGLLVVMPFEPSAHHHVRSIDRYGEAARGHAAQYLNRSHGPRLGAKGCFKGGDVPARPDLDQAICAWVESRLARDPALSRRYHDNGEQVAVPAIVVASAGGASRAAVWLLHVLDQLGSEVRNDVFAISAVSGSSLGAVTYLKALHGAGQFAGRLNLGTVNQELTSANLLSASIATQFLTDTLTRLFGWFPGWSTVVPDRGVALEGSFERFWRTRLGEVPAVGSEDGLVALRNAGDAGDPHLLLNGTDLKTGARIIASTISIDFPGTGDAIDLLHPERARRRGPADETCKEPTKESIAATHVIDLPAAGAVLASARFPVISPDGRYVARNCRLGQVIDGGYHDNSGLQTARDIARRLAAFTDYGARLKIVPIILAINNDADIGAEQLGERVPHCGQTQVANEGHLTRPVKADENHHEWEVLTLFKGLNGARGARGYDALQAARLEFCRGPFPGTGWDAHGSPPPPLPQQIAGLDRLFHFAVPKPRDPKARAEADPPAHWAPLNWVLNPDARRFLTGAAWWTPTHQFNAEQRDRLNVSLWAIRALRQGPPTSVTEPPPPPQPPRPPPIVAQPLVRDGWQIATLSSFVAETRDAGSIFTYVSEEQAELVSSIEDRPTVISATTRSLARITEELPGRPATLSKTFVVLFDTGRAELAPKAESGITEAAAWWRQHGGARIDLVGHADTQGNDRANLDLAGC